MMEMVEEPFEMDSEVVTGQRWEQKGKCTRHPCHTQVQARLWLSGALMTTDLKLLEYLEWPHECPAVLTKGLRVLLSWHRGASLIEKAAIRTRVVERSHWTA